MKLPGHRLGLLSSAFVAAVSVTFPSPFALAASGLDGSPSYGVLKRGAARPSQLIVRFEDDASASVASLRAGSVPAPDARSRVSALAALTARPLSLLRTLGSGALLVDAGGDLDDAALEELAAQIRRNAPPGLLRIEPDRVFQPVLTPNDPQLPNLWGLAGPAQSYGIAGINAFTAWDRSTGSGAVVGVIDTGYRPHADLAGQVVAQYDFISDATSANDGNGRDADASDPGDFRVSGSCGNPGSSNSSWHGTHVAGTIAALGNNALGVTGAAFGAKLVIARVLGRCGGMTSDIADAIIWASGGTVANVPANPQPARVLNMSLGGGYPCSASPELQNAINSARSRNTTVVVAAGNSNSDAANFSPASCSGVISVASIGDGGSRAPYSNYGTGVDIAAPGGDMSRGSTLGILSTYNSGATTPGNDSYAYLQGTSMASPHVAGVAALLVAAQPSLTPDQVEAAIKGNVRSFPGTCTGCGAGLIDATRALGSLAPTAGTLAFTGTAFTVAENGGSATISVQRTGGSAGAVTVAYATANGTATSADYTTRTGTLSWAAGDTATKTIAIPITNDTLAEATETVNLTLSGATGGATLGTARTAVLSITDDDSATGSINVSATAITVAENAGAVTVSVTRTGGSNGAASVAYATANGSATAGNDYSATNGTLTWGSGDSSTKTVRIPIANDTLSESSETLQLRLTSPVGATLGAAATSTVTITDDDTISAAGVVAVSAASVTVAENAGNATVTVSRTAGATGAISVAYATSNGTATAGSDYTAKSGTLSWAAGDATSKTIIVPITDDTLAEASETLLVTLSAPTGGATLGSNKVATVTVTDNDGQPGTVGFSATAYSIGESGGAVVLTVTRTGGSTGTAAVDYTTANGLAQAGSDFLASSGRLVWQNGDSAAKTITIPIYNDALREGAETILVRLSNVVTARLGTASATATIVDND